MDNQRDNSAYTMLITALEKNELHKYLIGEGGYKFVNPYVEEPTDITSIFVSGLDQYARNDDRAALKTQLKNAILTLMSSPEGCWWAVRLINSYLFQFKKGALKFEIPVSELLPALKTSLAEHKTALLDNKAHTGSRFGRGLWEQIEIDVDKINSTLKGENKIIL